MKDAGNLKAAKCIGTHRNGPSSSFAGPEVVPERSRTALGYLALIKRYGDLLGLPLRRVLLFSRNLGLLLYQVVSLSLVQNLPSTPLWSQTHTRSIVEPQPSPWLLLPRNLQPFATPDALDSILANSPVRLPQQRRDAPVTIASLLAG